MTANAGSGRRCYHQQSRESEEGVGFDAYKEEYVNMVEAGILDPEAKKRLQRMQQALQLQILKKRRQQPPEGLGLGMM